MASVKNLGGHKDKQTLLLQQPGLHGTNSHEGQTTSSVIFFLVIQILRQGRKGLGLSACRLPSSWPAKDILPSPPLPTCVSHKLSRAQQSPSGTAGHPCERLGWQLKYHPVVSTSGTGRAKGNNPRWVPSVGEQLTYGNWKGVACCSAERADSWKLCPSTKEKKWKRNVTKLLSCILIFCWQINFSLGEFSPFLRVSPSAAHSNATCISYRRAAPETNTRVRGQSTLLRHICCTG